MECVGFVCPAGPFLPPLLPSLHRLCFRSKGARLKSYPTKGKLDSFAMELQSYKVDRLKAVAKTAAPAMSALVGMKRNAARFAALAQKKFRLIKGQSSLAFHRLWNLRTVDKSVESMVEVRSGVGCRRRRRRTRRVGWARCRRRSPTSTPPSPTRSSSSRYRPPTSTTGFPSFPPPLKPVSSFGASTGCGEGAAAAEQLRGRRGGPGAAAGGDGRLRLRPQLPSRLPAPAPSTAQRRRCRSLSCRTCPSVLVTLVD